MRRALILAVAMRLLATPVHANEQPPTTLPTTMPISSITLDFDTSLDPQLQARLVAIDEQLRKRLDMTPEDAAVGLLDLRTGRAAMIHPDRIEYAASVPKIGILLAWSELHKDDSAALTDEVRHALGLMVKRSSNEMAARFSRELGLKRIQDVVNRYGLYDASHGGGIWVGKHYGKGDERYTDPVGDHSHAATVRQLLRFYLLLEQGRLVSPEASKTMRAIFESPELEHDQNKFVKGLNGRDVQIIRKWGTWENWRHDTAVIRGPDRHYVLVALTEHPQGDAYLEALALEVDVLMGGSR
jgi:beta-lactamase class A